MTPEVARLLSALQSFIGMMQIVRETIPYPARSLFDSYYKPLVQALDAVHVAMQKENANV